MMLELILALLFEKEIVNNERFIVIKDGTGIIKYAGTILKTPDRLLTHEIIEIKYNYLSDVLSIVIR